jgi:hypothetical protein
MIRRPPSLRRVAVESHCPVFSGTTRTLRLRPAPSGPAFVSFAGAVPLRLRLFAPSRLTMPEPRGRDVCGSGRPHRHLTVESRGSLKFSHRPPCRPAHAPTTPEEPDETPLNVVVRHGQGPGNGPGFFDAKTFEAPSHGLTACCLRFKEPSCLGTLQDSLPAARLRSAGRASHPQGPM